MSKQQYYDSSTFRPRSNIGYLTKRANSLMLDIMEPILERLGFSFIQYVILAWLRDGITVNPREICAQYRHDSGALTRVLDQLADRGLIERVRRDRDRRKVELELTDAGRATAEQLVPLVVERLNAALADFSRVEIEELERLLSKLNNRLQAEIDLTPPAVEAKA